MSHLPFPRLHFRGQFSATPRPANNGAKVSLQRGIIVDQDPTGDKSTQIIAAQFNLSSPAGLSLFGRPSMAVSRWVAQKNLGVNGFGALAAVWHSIIPHDLLTIVPGT